MKNLNLRDFIKGIKEDLQGAVDNKDPFFIMGEVELEVSFTLDVEAEGAARFLVADIKGGGGISHSHKAKIKLIPCNFDEANTAPKIKGVRTTKGVAVHPTKSVRNPGVYAPVYAPTASNPLTDINLKKPIRATIARKKK